MPMDMLWGQELFILPYKDCDQKTKEKTKALKDTSNQWIWDEEMLKGMEVEIYKQLYTVQDNSGQSFPLRGMFPN